MERLRVAGRLTKALQFPISLLYGAAGCGKSTALRYALRRDPRTHAIFDVGPEHATLPRFVQGFTEAISAQAPGARISFASAYDRAMLSHNPANALALWLYEHVKALDLTIAIDNAHNAESSTVQAFLGKLIDRSSDSLRWIIAARNLDYLPVANWLASSRMGLPIEEDELAFTPDEIEQLAHELKLDGVGTAKARELHERTAGWATGVAFLLRMTGSGVAFDGPALAYEPIIEKILADRDLTTLRALLSAYFLPDLSAELLMAAGGSALTSLIDDLRARAPFLFVETPQALHFHDLFRSSLRAIVVDADYAVQAAALERATSVLVRHERYVDILNLHSSDNAPTCLAILEEQGTRLIEQGNADVVEASIARLQRAGVELTAKIFALRALVESRLGRLDTAEAWFNQALASVEDDDAHMTEIKYLYACDLIHRDRLDCIPLLREHVDDEDISPSLRASILSALAEALQLSGEPEAAREAIAAAIDLERGIGDHVLHARVLARAAYVFLYQDEYALARSYALAAARVASEYSLYTIATGAYSVLYVIAFDEEDVEASLRYLDCLMESALKSGNLQFQFYCLACMFEIEMERNNTEAVRRICETLASFDIHIGGSVSDEAFFPGDALRSATHGDFERAYRLLFPTATNQAGPERIAQRWSEVALYAAGAMRFVKATHAVEHGLAALAQCGTSSARSARARLYFALTLALLGRHDEASSLLHDVASEPALPQRVRAIEASVQALCAYTAGEDNLHDVASALQMMCESECGGIGRLFESLPSRLHLRRESVA